MNRSFVFIHIFLALSYVPASLHSADETFYSQARLEVEKSLKGRQGIALWVDRQTNARRVWGDATVAEEFFRPGSLMKLMMAETVLRKGPAPDYTCRGHDRFKEGKLFCWKRNGHGALTLPKALSVSCNLYFAHLSEKLSAQEIVEALRRYSFSKAAGLVPASLTPSELILLAIGDSPEFHATPNEIADFWDHLLVHLQDPVLVSIRQGLSRASVEGTASSQEKGGLEILAKTGTSDSERETYRAHGWFVGAAPAENPRFALIVFLKDAYGFREAAELGRKIFSLAAANFPFEGNQ